MAVEFDYPLVEEIARNVDAALAEDVGAGDLTAALVPAARAARATAVAREAGVLCGRDWFDACVLRLDPAAQVQWSAEEGADRGWAGVVHADW